MLDELNIGTAPTIADVVESGLPTFAWDPHFHTSNLTADEASLLLYVYLKVRTTSSQQ